MCPEIKIFSLTLSSYLVLYSAAFLAVFLLCMIVAPKQGISRADGLRFFAIVIFAGIIGAKLAAFISSGTSAFIDYFIYHSRSKPTIAGLFTGSRFFGGMFLGFVAAALYAKLAKISPYSFMALIAIYLPLGLAIGRVGCFMNGCCYGTEYHGIFAVNFPGVGYRHPLQLYESAWYLATFAALFAMDKKKASRQTIIITYILSVTGIRFINEYLRPDANWALKFISINQLFALIMAAAVIFYIIFINNKEVKMHEKYQE